MALPPIPNSGIEADIDETLRQIGDAPASPMIPAARENIFKLDPLTKIPVSRHEGNVWKARRDASTKSMAPLIEGWEEAEHYYNNAQQNHRKETEGDSSGSRARAANRSNSYSMTENIVYATVNATIPNVIAKNPTIEVTMTDPSMEPLGVALEALGNRLANLRAPPGINLKSKMRKCVLRTEITNEAWVWLGWTKREDSADAAREDIARIASELEKAEDEQQIERLEGELLALEDQIDLLNPPGPFLRTVSSKHVRIDPAAEEDDFSDANWMMICMFESTKYLNARYRQKKKKDGEDSKHPEYVSAYEASHVVDAATASKDSSGVQDQINNFKMFDNAKDNPEAYGYNDRESYERAKRTAVWYCFDRVKRRFYMYSEKDWKWPIWCYDDPYHFPDFFPLERLQWHPSPTAPRTRGEVSHYLDQQDEINTIVDELHRSRTSLRDNTLFNSTVLSVKDVEDIILNGNKKIKGIKVPQGQKLEDLIMAPPQPNLEFQHLWDKSPAKAAVNMLSGLGEAMRSEQFKTNTTNAAIQEYTAVSNTRMDEKRDAIEDFIGAIMWKVLYMSLQFMDEQTFNNLTGNAYANVGWRQMQPDEIRHKIQCRVEGGSTQKPTSAAKKAEALQIGQILGQFVQASPMAIILALKVFQRAFDGFVVTDEEWNMLLQSVQQSIMAQSQQAAGPPQEEKPQPKQPAEGQKKTQEEAAVSDMVKAGMPESEARKRVAEATQGK